MNKTKFMQTDSRWGGLGYPKKPWFLRNCGCGEVSIANIIIEMDDYKSYTPATIQPWCKQFAAPNGNGTYFSGIPKMMSHYGLTEVKEHATMSQLWAELEKGDRVAIYLMGSKRGGSKRVHWTSGGHFVCSVGYKYQNGLHFVYVKDSYSNSSLRNGWLSYEEAMKGDVLRVWSGKLKTISATDYRPSTPYKGILPKSTVKDGSKGEDVKACQSFLNWCINAGLMTDGNCGHKTVKAIKIYQKTYGLSPDGKFGKASRAKAEEIIKAHDKHPYSGAYPNTTIKTTEKVSRGGEIVAKAKEYAWPYGTASSKYSYSKGSARPSYKAALKKYMNKSAKVSQSDCGYFVSTCVRASGVSSDFLALKGTKEAFPKVPSTMSVVHKGKKIPDGLLQPGDIIRYKKTSGQHTLMCYANGKIAEAGREHQFPAIESDTKKYTKSNVKLATLEVIRANPTTKTVTRSYLQRGDSGDEVKKLQKYINWFFHDKYGKDVLSVDGKFGVNTQNYCKLMQSDLGFTDCDGLIGPKTIEAMKGWRQ